MKKNIYLSFLFIITAFSARAQQSFADLAEKSINSVVNISTMAKTNDNYNEENDNTITLGSGFIIDKEGYIVTNNHVIDRAEKIYITLNNEQNYEAFLVGKDEKTDVALIKIDPKTELQPVTFGNSDEIRVGDWILAIGNPFGLGSSVTSGIISAKSRDIDSGSYNDFIQTDAPINQGNSGGPMFNMNGEVIGMNTSIFSTTGNSMGISFATPSNIIVWVVDHLKKYGEVKRGWIGIKMQPQGLDKTNNEQSGILVLGISENSPAQKAGIKAGDIILKINNEPIESPKNFSKIVYTYQEGKKLNLTVWNNNKTREVSLIVEMQPEIKDSDSYILSENIEDIDANKHNFIPEIGLLYEDEKNEGLIIIEPDKNSDISQYNISKGDIILKIDNYRVETVDDLRNYIKNQKFSKNNKLNLSILKNNEIKNITITLD